MEPVRWKKIERLFQTALEMEPGKREAYLKGACAEDESLMKEVESLLANRSEAEGFMKHPAMEAAAKVLAREQENLPAQDLIGRTISHYRIVDRLGRGGMGEVFLAEDTSLNRKVALKFLPDIFSGDPEPLARFEREAKLLASLNHPNIAAIHGLEAANGKSFLVLELVEGETLAQRIAKGPLPIDEALEACRQIAEGVEAAHEKGIIHRDLKPANVKITPEGKIKVLDFGLAKAFQEETSAADASHSPTLTDQMTRPGVILGTAAYMAPEQAKGKALDKRADIWAFGCILYECLTGRRSFQGETVTETLASILKGEPDWQALPPASTLKVKDLLHRCLQKDPKERLHDIADARIEISQAIREPISSELYKGVVPVRTNWRLVIPVAIACLAVGAVMSFLIWNRMQKPKSERVVRFPFVLPTSQRFTDMFCRLVALSPDGSRLVYVANNQLFLRPLDSTEVLPIHGTEGFLANPIWTAARNPFFSPDGQWIGFWADYKLQKIPISGGKPAILCDCPIQPYGASWADDNTVVFGCGPDGIWQVPATGGKRKLLIGADSDKGEVLHGPQMLMGGKYVLFTLKKKDVSSWDDAQIVVQSLQTGERHVLIEGGTDAHYVPTGHLVYMRENKVLAVPFDPNRPEKTGDPVLLVEDVKEQSGKAQFSFSEDGTFAYVPATDGGLPKRTLNWVDRQGKVSRAIPEPLPIRSLGLSPDGHRVAVMVGKKNGEADIWVYDLSGKTAPYPVTRSGRNSDPVWTPDGKQIVFAFDTSGIKSNLHRIVADGSTLKAEVLLDLEGTNWPYSFGLHGELLFQHGMYVWILDPAKGNKPQPLFAELDGNGAVVSPDGRFLAFQSQRTGNPEIWVVEYPDLKGPRRISFNGGVEPRWSPAGKELYYLEGDKIMAVSVRLQPIFENDHPRELFAGNWRTAFFPTYNVAPDGRFLMIRENETSNETPTTQQINIVLNWFEELKRLVPTREK